MLSCYIGYLAVIFLIYSLSYKKINKFIGKIKMVKVLKMHYIVGTVAVAFSIIHSIMNLRKISISLGTIGLAFMICSFITGVFIRYFKKKNRNTLVAIHISVSILSLVVVVFHIIQYYILV